MLLDLIIFEKREELIQGTTILLKCMIRKILAAVLLIKLLHAISENLTSHRRTELLERTHLLINQKSRLLVLCLLSSLVIEHKL